MLTTAGLAALVDSVGGIQAAVDVDVVTTDAKGNETVVVQAGNQHLKGAAAAAYATYLAEGEPEQARLARFDDVLTAVAAALPQDRAALGGRAGRARRRVRARRWTPRRWPTGWLVLGSAADDGSLVSDVLPVTEIDTGGAVTSYGHRRRPGRPPRCGPGSRARCSRTPNGESAAGPGRERCRDPRAGGEGPHQAGGRRVPVHQRRQRLAVQQRPERRAGAGRHREEPRAEVDGSRPPSGCPASLGAP